MTFITKQDQARELGISDLSEYAQNLILNTEQKKWERELSRIEFTKSILSDIKDKSSFEQAIGMGVLELIGTGGHDGLGWNYGGSSDRHDHFSRCGTGRRRANDGSAWDDSIRIGIEIFARDYLGQSIGRFEFVITMMELDDKLVPALAMRDNNGDDTCLFWLAQEEQDDSFHFINNTFPNIRALCGQVLITLTREQEYIALTCADSSYDSTKGYNTSHGGIKIDRSMFSEMGIELMGRAVTHFSGYDRMN